MNQLLNGVARAVSEAFDLPGPILEIGSYQVSGQKGIADLRGIFRARPYVGIDVRPGPGVDQIADVEALPHAKGSIGTVIALSTFEHVKHFWRGLDEVYRVLRKDGAFLISCPFSFHIHNYPSDYWRFTPEALEVLLQDYPSKILGWHGPGKRPQNVWALAFREERPQITQHQFEHYRRLLARYARQPLAWRKQVRYRVGRLICGRRPFAQYLEQAHWKTELRNTPPAQVEKAAVRVAAKSFAISADAAAVRSRSARAGRGESDTGLPPFGTIPSPAPSQLYQQGVASYPRRRRSPGAGVKAWENPFLDGGPADVSICIVNWNCRDYLRACLDSLHYQPQGVRFETIVVDNGSEDGAADMVERDFPEVILVRNTTNLGFARANNQAAELAAGRFLFFLNNDTQVPEDALSRLVDYADAHPEVGILGPRLRNGEGELQISYRLQPTLRTFLHRTSLLRWTGIFRGAYRRYRREDFDPDTTRPVEVLMGAAMFIPRKVFLDVGGWDAEFTFGGEDAELSTRIGRDHPLVFHPDVEIKHFGRVSTRRHIGFATAQMMIGFARYLRKCGYSGPALALFKAIVTLDAPISFSGKGIQYLWRRATGQKTKAGKSLLAMRGLGRFLVSGLVPFWKT
jgi:N-acetylglucosaminyl-diphospho-decaprenol L-rhamnosyltransferase